MYVYKYVSMYVCCLAPPSLPGVGQHSPEEDQHWKVIIIIIIIIIIITIDI
jgi:hypothetical protein